MKKIKLTTLAFCLLASWSVRAQTAEQQANILRHTNSAVLQQLAKSAEEEYQRNYALALEKAKEKNWIVYKKLPDGGFMQLSGIDKNGAPIYEVSDNVNSAKSIRTNLVHPNTNNYLNLTGKSLTLHEWDGGRVLLTHQELVGRVVQVDNSSTVSDHATHVAGTMIASGVSATAKGMAYESKIRAYDSGNDLSEMTSATTTGMIISNHSYGQRGGFDFDGSSWRWYGNDNISTTEDYKFGFYDNTSAGWDNVAFNAPYYLISKSAGNQRGAGPAAGTSYIINQTGQSSTVPRPANPQYETMTNRAVAKNLLTVGAVNDVLNYTTPNSVGMSSFSSWGPTDDGRIKPDVVTNGVSVNSSIGTDNSAYSSYNGTSMAAPAMAGSALLLQEHFSNTHGKKLMRAATLKGLIIHTADEAGTNVGPDYAFGWGLMNTFRAAQVISKDSVLHKIEEKTLANNTQHSAWVYASGTEPLRATICWTDRAGTPAPVSLNPINKMLVNDLDLRITDSATSTATLPWKLDRNSPANAAIRADNDVDNVEQVLIANPVAGWYKIKVSHKGTLVGNLQAYSLIVSGIVTADTNRLCKNTLYFGASEGVFDDGSGSLNYRDNADCSWGIQTDTNTAVSISFNQFNVAAGDTLRIYNGANRNAPLLAKLSGNAIPAALVTSTRRAFIAFSSNNAGAAAGWILKYQSVIKPNINFVPTATQLCENEVVSFNATVSNTDTVGITWNWTFNGGIPATFVGRKPYVKFPQAGKYNVTVSASNSVGSTVLTKNEVVNVVPDTGLFVANYAEGFEAVTFPNAYANMYKNWTITGDNTWQRSTVEHFGGIASLSISNGGSTRPRRELIAPMVDVKSNPSLSTDYKVYFWRKYVGTTPTSSDILRLFTSTNCGKTWQQRYIKQGVALSTNEAWAVDSTINLAGLLINNIWIKFSYEGNSSGTLYMDSLLIGKVSSVTSTTPLFGKSKINVVPNPFVGDAQILFSLEQPQETRWSLADVLGRVHAEDVSLSLAAGEQNIKLSDLVKTKLPAGMYWLRVENDKKQASTIKIMVLE